MTQEALKLALDALKTELSIDWTNNDEFNKSAEKMYKAIAAIKEALAQPEQEPVATVTSETGADITMSWWHEPALPIGTKLYTSSPQRTWVGLADDEMEATFIECGGKWNGDFWKIEDADFYPFLRTIEAKLKQKNGFAEEKNT